MRVLRVNYHERRDAVYIYIVSRRSSIARSGGSRWRKCELRCGVVATRDVLGSKAGLTTARASLDRTLCEPRL